MMTYLITLQLSSPESAYTGLIAYLKTAPNWARPMNNVWIIKTDIETVDLRDGIKSRVNISKGDKVLVIKLKDGFWATNNLSKEVTDWMNLNL